MINKYMKLRSFGGSTCQHSKATKYYHLYTIFFDRCASVWNILPSSVVNHNYVDFLLK